MVKKLTHKSLTALKAILQHRLYTQIQAKLQQLKRPSGWRGFYIYLILSDITADMFIFYFP
jgi:hypothetical protein